MITKPPPKMPSLLKNQPANTPAKIILCNLRSISQAIIQANPKNHLSIKPSPRQNIPLDGTAPYLMDTFHAIWWGWGGVTIA
jgi:hypothetical protein